MKNCEHSNFCGFSEDCNRCNGNKMKLKKTVSCKDMVEGKEYYGLPSGVYEKEKGNIFYTNIFGEKIKIKPHPNTIFYEFKSC